MKFLFNPSPKTFTEAIHPVWFVLRLAGLASHIDITTTTTVIANDPYGATPRGLVSSSTADNRWQLRKPSLLSRSYPPFVVSLLFISFAVSQYAKHAMAAITLPNTVLVSDWVTSSLTLVTCTSFVVSLSVGRETIADIFRKINYIDGHLLEDSTSVYARMHRLAWTQVLIMAPTIAFMTTIDFIDRRKFLGSTRAMLLHSTQPLSFVFELGLLQFVNILLLLRQRYKILNGLLEDFGRNVANPSRLTSSDDLRDEPSTESLPVVDLFTSLRTLRKIHFSLYEIATTTNSIHGFSLFSSILCLFLSITFLLYISIVHALNHQGSATVAGDALYMVATKLLWSVHYACAVVSVTYACHVTQDEAGRAAILVNGCLLTDGLPVALSGELDRFAKQVAQVRLEFTANGFFRIDFGLLCAMSGAITTYLVILVQFR